MVAGVRVQQPGEGTAKTAVAVIMPVLAPGVPVRADS
jgi:hypothetical protein